MVILMFLKLNMLDAIKPDSNEPSIISVKK